MTWPNPALWFLCCGVVGLIVTTWLMLREEGGKSIFDEAPFWVLKRYLERANDSGRRPWALLVMLGALVIGVAGMLLFLWLRSR
jgi:hypothetical protein